MGNLSRFDEAFVEFIAVFLVEPQNNMVEDKGSFTIPLLFRSFRVAISVGARSKRFARLAVLWSEGAHLGAAYSARNNNSACSARREGKHSAALVKD